MEDGYAYFASDLFSKFALAYELMGPPNDPEPGPEDDKEDIVPGDPKNSDPEKISTNGSEAKTDPARAVPAETGDPSDMYMWLLLMTLAAGAALIAAVMKRQVVGDRS